MTFRFFFLFCVVNMPFMSSSQSTAVTKPRLIILTTGGTIASVNGQPMIDGPALVQAVPDIAQHATITVETFSKIGSSQMTPAHWLRLAQRINQLLQDDPGLSGVVITHGTDTMEETAYFLNLAIRSKKPIVLVGSMRSANEISADGPANLLNAVRVAVDENSIGKGVLVVLNEEISAAREVWKTHNRRVETFQSAAGFLGVVDPDQIRYYRNPIHPHTYQVPFELDKVTALPKVELVMDFTGFDPAILTYFAGKGLDGLVIGSFAGGRISSGMLEGMKRAAEKGIPLVIASQVPEGRIIGYPSYPFPVVFAPDLSPKKARILLLLALMKTQDTMELQTFFERY